MVESADEPPLRGLHSWAKSKTPSFVTNPFKSKKRATASPQTPNQVLPQHAGHIEADRAGNSIASSEDHVVNIENTQQQGAPVVDTQGNGTDSTTMTTTDSNPKPSLYKRFVRDVKRIITSSWINWLLVFVPLGIILGALNDWAGMDFVSPSAIFAINAVAIIPLASMLAFATESVALKMGDAWGALLNVTFGNAVEIIIFVIGLAGGEVRIVQAAALGSILSNLLLILGMCFVFGGLRFREQLYNSSVSQMSACLLSLSVISLLLPTAFHAAFANSDRADRIVLKVSRGTSVVLLLVYALYLIFQLKSHAFMYESTPQHVIDEESHPGVLADMLNSSSSSSDDSSSSSSDSDATADSHKTSSRFRRALRRKRRKSSSGMKGDVPLQNLSTSGATLTTESQPQITRIADDDVHSGDEADVEHRRGRAGPQQTIEARDFEDEKASVFSGSKRHRKSKKSRAKRRNATPEELGHAATVTEKAIPSVQARLSSEVQQTSTDALRRPFHIRQLSTAVKPAFNSTVFPHHEASGRQLALPIVRCQDRPNANTARRASSMPDINRRSAPMIASIYPQPTAVTTTGPIEVVTEDTVDATKHLSRTSAVVLLLCTTGLVALCAEFLVGSIDYLISNSGISQLFVGLIILPIVGNAAEHVTAVTVAYKNKMDLAINIALGSSIQIALFVTPLMVILGWIIHEDMSLYFSLFETMSLFSSAFIINYLMIDGRSNYLEGTLLIAAYVIIAIAAFFYPDCGLSATSGTDASAVC